MHMPPPSHHPTTPPPLDRTAPTVKAARRDITAPLQPSCRLTNSVYHYYGWGANREACAPRISHSATYSRRTHEAKCGPEYQQLTAILWIVIDDCLGRTARAMAHMSRTGARPR